MLVYTYIHIYIYIYIYIHTGRRLRHASCAKSRAAVVGRAHFIRRHRPEGLVYGKSPCLSSSAAAASEMVSQVVAVYGAALPTSFLGPSRRPLRRENGARAVGPPELPASTAERENGAIG